jgi:hypothetical protein
MNDTQLSSKWTDFLGLAGAIVAQGIIEVLMMVKDCPEEV